MSGLTDDGTASVRYVKVIELDSFGSYNGICALHYVTSTSDPSSKAHFQPHWCQRTGTLTAAAAKLSTKLSRRSRLVRLKLLLNPCSWRVA
jgi:hypothetical protein